MARAAAIPARAAGGRSCARGEHEKEISGGERLTTNNRMELMAAIKALEALKKPSAVTLYTDSKYVMDGLNQWLPRWKANGWKTADKKPVKNDDLWKRARRSGEAARRAVALGARP